MNYEEEPSGVHAGLVAIKTKREDDYRAYEACRGQIEGMTKGYLKVHRDKAIRIVQTLFLVYLARTRQRGITAEEIANGVLIERDAQATSDENVQHYETLAANLHKELTPGRREPGRRRTAALSLRSHPHRGNPRQEFRKARDEAESNEARQREAWEFLLALDEWPVQTRQMTLDLSERREVNVPRDRGSGGTAGPTPPGGRTDDHSVEVTWRGRRVAGLVAMHNLARTAADNVPLRRMDTDQTDLDFSLYVSNRPVSPRRYTNCW